MRVAGSLDELLAGATERRPLKPVDSKSGAAMERVLIGGTSYVVKHFTAPDWLADGSDDRTCRAVELYERGIYSAVADILDSTVVAAARLERPDGWPAALLMRDASDEFVAVDAPIDESTHAAILEAMAALHARWWSAPPDTTYMPLARNYDMLSPRQATIEREALGDRSEVLRAVPSGWARFADERADTYRTVAGLLDDPAPLVEALLHGPQTFLHGDWKMGNLGRRADGRVVLVDWDRPAVGPPTVDLAWFIAVNCDRLRESKDDAIARYHRALQAHGIATGDWWADHTDLALLGAFLMLGWSKADQPDELAWWSDVVRRAASLL